MENTASDARKFVEGVGGRLGASKSQAYADAVHDRSTQMLGTHQAMMDAWRKDGSLAFDKAYDLHIQVMQAHLDAMKANRDAALKLYDGLTEDQRKKASWVLPASMCMM